MIFIKSVRPVGEPWDKNDLIFYVLAGAGPVIKVSLILLNGLDPAGPGWFKVWFLLIKMTI